MHHATPLSHAEVENHLRSLRCRARLSQRQLADLSRVSPHTINHLEGGDLHQLISDRAIQQAVESAGEVGAARFMRQTLLGWAEQFHRLATALDVPLEQVFPADYLAALGDRLWLQIYIVRKLHAVLEHQPYPIFVDNPWHDWGWFREEPLSEELAADAIDPSPEPDDLAPLVRSILTGLPELERAVLTRLFGLDGCTYTLREIGQELDLPTERVRRIEEKALRRLRQPFVSRRLRGYLI